MDEVIIRRGPVMISRRHPVLSAGDRNGNMVAQLLPEYSDDALDDNPTWYVLDGHRCAVLKDASYATARIAFFGTVNNAMVQD